MKHVTILCTDPLHPVNQWLKRWSLSVAGRAQVEILRDVALAHGGDFLFMVSCQQIVRKATRDKYRFRLVLHASELPQGRGMSPHIWQLLEGRERLTLSLLDAEDQVDSGAIWHQLHFEVPRTDLADEINARLFAAEMEMLDWALAHCEQAQPRVQAGQPSYYRRRTPADSEIDVNRPLADAFDVLRLADPDRYPAFFVYRGQRYRIRIDKL
jgi:methionyl-tRNA formyltransferase